MEKTVGHTHNVAILVNRDSAASMVFGVYDMLVAAGSAWNAAVGGGPPVTVFNPILVSENGDQVKTVYGVSISPDASLADCPEVSCICIPALEIAPDHNWQAEHRMELEWLKERFDSGCEIAAGCSGTLMPAELGLLDGYEATTHWAFAKSFSRNYPKVRLRTSQNLLVSGPERRVVMASGGTAVLDLALFLIARYSSVELAMQVAKLFVIEWHHRPQTAFTNLAMEQPTEDAVVDRCKSWLISNYHLRSPVKAMQEISGLAEATFKRRFRKATGISPIRYVQDLRLEEAKRLLENTDCSIESIADAIGYDDAGYFARLFRRYFSLSPQQYRRRYRTVRLELAKAAR